ncbi:hypothetical protein SAMN04489730_8397 [Amycolatopsis australiensis]|uniref:Uncharacterized protein n=1 Tax=Amycolatopsis australiensis TaxID=546364 RepID=A0A1K1T6C7_9PSEU|nr:hypothetical protein SAMN04489730_8397 [Amycolatopsis australiensis]
MRRNSTGAGGRLHDGNRSENYRKALRALDGSGSLGAVDVDEFVDAIRKEFADRYCSIPVGIVGKCYLGEPFEVHTLALDGAILEHYHRGQVLPGGLERARALAVSPAYLAVEVYPDRMVCARADGSIVIMESDS